MSATVRIVCLANSRKHGGRCVAGLTFGMSPQGEWVRPISPYGTGELNWECLYTDSSEPRPLDLVELTLAASRPISLHTENCLIDPTRTWAKIGTVPFREAALYAEPPVGQLWIDSGSTAHGENDRIPAELAAGLSSSLKLIQPANLMLRAAVEGHARPRRVVRGSFAFGRYQYTLAVTDPAIENEFATQSPGTERKLRSPLLCLSISELFEKRNEHYKLIAGVIEAS